MKRILILLSVAIIFVACSKTEEKAQNEPVENEYQMLTIADFENQAETLTNKKVRLEGKVIHVCKHSGKRAFIVDGDDDTSVKIEAAENSPGFKMELMGSRIAVNGVVEESRMTKEEIEEREKEILADIESQKAEEGENCVIEGTHLENLDHVNEMKAQMEKTGKPYVSFYYVRCNDFAEVNQETKS